MVRSGISQIDIDQHGAPAHGYGAGWLCHVFEVLWWDGDKRCLILPPLIDIKLANAPLTRTHTHSLSVRPCFIPERDFPRQLSNTYPLHPHTNGFLSILPPSPSIEFQTTLWRLYRKWLTQKIIQRYHQCFVNLNGISHLVKMWYFQGSSHLVIF